MTPDLITVDDAIRAKKQELRNVKNLIERYAKQTARRLHKKFVKAGGCRVCWGTGEHTVHLKNLSTAENMKYMLDVNAFEYRPQLCCHLSCTPESRELSGVDPMLPRASYDEIDSHRWYIKSLGNGLTIDNPIRKNEVFDVMTRELYVQKSKIENELNELKGKKSFTKGDKVIVCPRRKYEHGACNYGRLTNSLAYVPENTVLELELSGTRRSYSYAERRYVTCVWCKDGTGASYRLIKSDLKKLVWKRGCGGLVCLVYCE